MQVNMILNTVSCISIISECELTFMLAICYCPSVCLLSVCL